MDKGTLYVLAAAVLWGTTGTAQALAPDSAQPLAVGALRLAAGGLALLVVYLARRGNHTGNLPANKMPAGPVLLTAACMAAYQVLFFAGVDRTGVAVGTIVGIGSSPILAGILGYIVRGERLSRRWGIATLLAVAGCSLLAMTGQKINIDPLGMLLAIGAGGAYAIFSLASKDMLEHHPVEKVMAAAFGLGALLLAPVLFFQDLSWLQLPEGIGAILWLGIMATALAYSLFGKGLQLTPVATAVTLSLAEPLTAAMLGVLVLRETVSLQASIGIALVFSGLVVLTFRKNGSQKQAG